MLETFLIILICAVLFAGAFFLARYVVFLQTTRDMMEEEIEKLREQNAELEARVVMLESERDTRQQLLDQLRTGEPTNGWELLRG